MEIPSIRTCAYERMAYAPVRTKILPSRIGNGKSFPYVLMRMKLLPFRYRYASRHEFGTFKYTSTERRIKWKIFLC